MLPSVAIMRSPSLLEEVCRGNWSIVRMSRRRVDRTLDLVVSSHSSGGFGVGPIESLLQCVEVMPAVMLSYWASRRGARTSGREVSL